MVLQKTKRVIEPRCGPFNATVNTGRNDHDSPATT